MYRQLGEAMRQPRSGRKSMHRTELKPADSEGVLVSIKDRKGHRWPTIEGPWVHFDPLGTAIDCMAYPAEIWVQKGPK